MADEKKKLVAEISGDAKPMQQALDASKKSVEQTAKAVNQTSQQTRQGYDRAAQAAQKMGQTGAGANMTVAQAVRHPIQAVKTLAIEARNAAAALLGMGQAGRQASAATKEAGGALGNMIGLGSKMAILAKGFQSLKYIIETALVAPLRDAYKETERLAKMRLNVNMGIYGGQAERWGNAKKEIAEYYDLLTKANAAEATNADKLKAQDARRALERRGFQVDTESGTPEGGVRKALDDAQSEYIKALEGKEREVNKALADMKAAYEKLTAPGAEFLWGTNQSGYAAEVNRLQGEVGKLSDQSTALRGEIMAAKKETPGEDFSRRVAADAADRLARQMDEEAKASEEAARRRDEAERKLAEAEERRAGIERRLADEGRLEAMQHTRDLLNHQMGRFGFGLTDYDEENLNESVRDRVQRQRNVRLDARIEAKRQRLAEGRKVHFTPAEQRRMDEWRALKAKGEELTAEEQAMQAAKKQESAAIELDNAAKAISDAAAEIKDAEAAGETAGKALDEAAALLTKIENERDFYELTATKGQSAVPDYGGILGQIRDILDGQSDRVYIVK